MTSTTSKLATARLVAVQRMPYFAAALYKLSPVEAPGLGTMAVTETGVMLYDPAFVEQHEPRVLAGVLLHEALHVVRGHAQRCRAAACDARLWNIAADMEINDDLRGNFQLPEGAIFPESAGLQPGGLAETYAQQLRQQAATCPQCGGSGEQDGGDGEQDGDDSEQDGDDSEQDGDEQDGDDGAQQGQDDTEDEQDGQGHGGTCPACKAPKKPTACGGWDGSGAGREVPGEEGKDAEQRAEIDAAKRSQAELDAMRRQVAQEVQAAREKARGNVPAGIGRWADELLAPPKIDWRLALAQAVRDGATYRPGAVDYRFGRPARRQAALGYGHDVPVMPRMVQPVPRIAVAIDTSGSMSPHDLRDALVEVEGILKAAGVADATFCACDAAASEVTRIASAREAADRLVGGGGTDFGPAIEKLAAAQPRPDVIVYATDGWGPAPAEPPEGVRVIWLLVGDTAHRPSFPAGEWGDMIFANEAGKEQSGS